MILLFSHLRIQRYIYGQIQTEPHPENANDQNGGNIHPASSPLETVIQSSSGSSISDITCWLLVNERFTSQKKSWKTSVSFVFAQFSSPRLLSSQNVFLAGKTVLSEDLSVEESFIIKESFVIMWFKEDSSKVSLCDKMKILGKFHHVILGKLLKSFTIWFCEKMNLYPTGSLLPE